VELVKRLEQSSSFRDARIVEESELKAKDSADTVQFHLTALYVPRPVSASGFKRTETKAEQAKPSAATGDKVAGTNVAKTKVAEGQGGPQ
jgi:hypothetical protein